MGYVRTLIQIRERSFFEVLDLSLMVLRRWPRKIGLSLLAGILPFGVFNDWLYRVHPELSVLWWIPMLLLEVPWATAPLTVVLGGLLFGESPRPWRVFRRIISAAPSLVLNQIIIRGLILATVFFSPLVFARLPFLNEVILLERTGGIRPIRRCSQLCVHRETDLIGRWSALLIYSLIFVVCFVFGTQVLLMLIVDTEGTWSEASRDSHLGIRFQVAIWIAVGFSGIVRFLSYIDERIRREGWAVELSLREATQALENSIK